MQQNVNQQIGDVGDEDFAAMFEASLKERGGEGILKEGEIVKGTVVQVTKDYAIVDIGYKSEGQVPISEFTSPRGEVSVKAGDPVEVLLESRENDTGMVVLSKEKADKMRIWDEISAACERDEIVKGTIVGRVKGGLSVDIGVKAFLPGSQVDIRPVRNLDQYISKEFEFKVIKFNKKRGNIVLSRRVLLEKQREEMKKETLKNLKEGAVLKGVVKNLTDYGAFIDLGGIDGLLHITDMSWGRIGHPSEMFNVGDEVRVVVLKFDPTQERVSLGLKQIQEDPWHRADEKYPVGTRVRGKTVSITDYGAFIEIEQGVEGLVHVSEMSWTKRLKHPSKMLEVGQEVEAVVLDIDPKAKRIALGMKQIEQNPWTLLEDKYPIGSVIKGQIRNVTDFGVFVGVEEGVDGLVHVSDISWTQRIKHPGEMFKKGDEVEAVVLNIDVENERFSLGIKQLQPDPWDTLSERTPVGSRVKGKVTKVTDFGAFVEIEPGIEGLVHVSELKEERVENPRDVVQEGQEVEVKIIDINTQDRKVALSMKALIGEGEDYREYLRRQAEGSKARLGDVMASKLKK
ncbi:MULTISPECIES: 30S ribosomal protein S1 [Archangium]|uniref:Small ribosomal subunit protein bS1 n=1 Tax=Archangium violaceum Cb vi76 TaxID=1406225 RepID=A0A084SZM1_9BACT|nr:MULTISPECIES: 30S ribosomal protein S1 [Archangium]KFA93906.1 30S ribosomal protein S1 [Archangium violaceum Cb vi76]HEX5751716.1 30S ribosomal protein S1 [Archangium sp.]